MRQQEHLRETVERLGTGDATRRMERLLGEAVEKDRATRLAQRLGKQKTNPYVTDAEKCRRQVFLSLRGQEPDPLSLDSLINFAVGSAVEEAFAAMLVAAGASMVREVRVEIPVDGSSVSGRADFLLILPEGLAERVGLPAHSLIELKSVASRAMQMMLKGNCTACGRFWSHTKDGEPYEKCQTKGCVSTSHEKEQGKKDHRAQLNQYLHASQLGLLPGGSFDRGFLVYVVKDAIRGEPPIHAFEVKYDEGLALKHLAEASLVAGLARDGKDPGVPEGFAPQKFPCAWCGFRSFCWPDWKE